MMFEKWFGNAIQWFNYPGFLAWSDCWAPRFFVIGLCLMSVGLIYGLVFAPTDYQQGDAFRLMYIHVPCAIMSLMLYSVMAVSSLCYLIFSIKLGDVLQEAIAPIGCMMTVLACITGSIWGKPMWGTWWIWDARLTSEFILAFIYAGLMMMRQVMPVNKQTAKAIAMFCLIGAVDLPIIHFSVTWWNTLHQPPSLLALQMPTIAVTMLLPLLVVLIGLIFWSAWVVLIQSRQIIIQRRVSKQVVSG